MKLFYVEETGKDTFITEADDDQKIYQAIENYMSDHNLGWIYMVNHVEKGKLFVDIGKYGCFFMIEL